MVRAITACSAALVCLAFGLLAASSARAAPYPPTQPCAVTAWRYGPLAADGSAEYSVTGTGLGPSQPVRLSLASRTVLGQTTTDPAGGFAAHVRAPREAAGGVPITAATARQTCNSGPPGVNPAPSASATAPPSEPLSAGGGQTTDGAGTTAPGAATPGTPTPGATTSTLPSGSASLGAPLTGGPSGRPSAPAPRAEPGLTHAISAYLGLVIAAVLLVLGTLAVLLLTRRAGH